MTEHTPHPAPADPACDTFDERLLAYLEGDLAAADRAWTDAHRASCARCDALVRDLDDVIAQAAALPPITPVRELWTGIAERLDTPVVTLRPQTTDATVAAPSMPPTSPSRPTSRRTISVRVFAIAASLLIAVTSAITWRVARPNSDSPADSGVVATTKASVKSTPPNTESSSTLAVDPSAVTGVIPAANADVVYEHEIGALRSIVNARFAELDSTTVSELRRNLDIIDKAIADSRAALEKAPNSRALSTSLDRALESKLALMRRVALL